MSESPSLTEVVALLLHNRIASTFTLGPSVKLQRVGASPSIEIGGAVYITLQAGEMIGERVLEAAMQMMGDKWQDFDPATYDGQ